jgi:hypothetical protein
VNLEEDGLMMLSLDSMVHKEAFVRIIDAFVDALDLESFDFLYFKLNKSGRPPFHPADLLKLYLYGYQKDERTFSNMVRDDVWETSKRGNHEWVGRFMSQVRACLQGFC